MRLENKTAVITGGGSGIGLSCARLFCREGARSVIFGRRKARLDEAVQEIGDRALAVSGDITCDEDIQRLVKTAVDAYGKIDILVNNAGVFTGSPVHETKDGDWDSVLKVNLTCVFKLTREVLPHMIRQKSGSLIHISSILGLVGTPNVAAYNTSKGALNQFSRSLAVEYGPSQIRSNAICPGLIATEMTEDLMHDEALMKEWSKNYPIGRFGQPEDVAQACLFLASDESTFITGTVLPVDGGYTAM
ncbi:MAG: 3-oxoacyl-ACP reductase [Nitrospinaceae bacterium]|nr:MAG: 3-oxoacyl-ACP reductase [Nitrospinaceae bacterium]